MVAVDDLTIINSKPKPVEEPVPVLVAEREPNVSSIQRPKLAFGSKGSLCVGMTESDCGKAKVACQWVKGSADGKRKAHCSRRAETKYDMGKLKLGGYYYYGEIQNEKANGYGELYDSDKKTLLHRGQFKNNRIHQ